jgi:hypothetical protein
MIRNRIIVDQIAPCVDEIQTFEGMKGKTSTAKISRILQLVDIIVEQYSDPSEIASPEPSRSGS